MKVDLMVLRSMVLFSATAAGGNSGESEQPITAGVTSELRCCVVSTAAP